MMKHIFYKILLLAIGVLFSETVNAQLNMGGLPYSFEKAIARKKVPVVRLPAINLKQIKEEDIKEATQGLPPRFGYPIEVQLDLANAGQWTALSNGDRLWRLSIEAKTAKSINLLYDQFWLPEGATLYIYGQDKRQLIGGFTAKNNKGAYEKPGGFATGLVYSDFITLEYYEPAAVADQGIISIAKVVHGYRYINVSQERALNDSGTCQTNINCPEGNNWQNEKKGVAMILVGGTRWCSGSLIITSARAFTPYFLTANHCLNGLDASANPQATNWTFYWHYESPDCNNLTTDFTPSSTNGAVVVANNMNSDFALLRLTEDPRDLNTSLWYNGWDVSGNPTNTGAGIHHPRGDTKKISLYTDAPSDDYDCAPDYTWTVRFEHPDGTFSSTERGSSGSPLFDANKRIIGQLWGGFHPDDCLAGPTCSDPENDYSYYGKLSDSWNGPSSNGLRQRIRDWVAPECHNSLNITASITEETPVKRAASTITATNRISNNAYAVYKAGATITLRPGFHANTGTTFRGILGACSSNGRSANQNFGTIKLPSDESKQAFNRAKAKDIDSKVATLSSSINLTNSPNPFYSSTLIQYQLEQATKVEVLIYNTNGQLLRKLVDNYQPAGLQEVVFDANQLPSGIYYCTLKTAHEMITRKLVFQR